MSMILASATAAAAPPSAGSKGPSKTNADQTLKYCVESEPFTGSKVVKTECKTKAEWAKEGVNVDQLKTR
ncbi:MAG: hypothetical protein ACJ8EP_06300 [Sphingomicrobium sp.]